MFSRLCNRMLLNKNEFDKVIGEIYKITNLVTNKCYIGQTRSHRLNHAKYRPFGYMGRFKDHIHEANSNKKFHCRYLNASILKYGSDNFTCQLIQTCNVNDLDDFEIQYISELNTKYPNGYNLTNGGKGFGDLNDAIIIDTIAPPPKAPRDFTRNDTTKLLISQRVRAAKSHPDHRKMMMEHSQKQHLSKKFDRFRHVTIDLDHIDKYIHIVRKNKDNSEYVNVKIDRSEATFVGKFETIHQIKERAKQFILDLKRWQCDQIAGTPLEPSLPLISGNLDEELG